MNKHLIPKAEFAALVEDAKKSDTGREKLWFEISSRLRSDWDGMSLRFFDAFTPGQSALVYGALFCEGAKHDFLTSITGSEISLPALKAFELLGAQEYLELLRQVESVFPGGKFPQHAEGMLKAHRKQPKGYFEEMGLRFATGKTMKRPLRDYIFEYVTTHPEAFSTTL